MDLNLYRKKTAKDRALKGKPNDTDNTGFLVFAIRNGGYFTREPLCSHDAHRTLLDACVCAGIRSKGSDMERYGKEIEITLTEGTVNLYTGQGITVIRKEQIVKAFETAAEKATAPESLSPIGYQAFDGYGMCGHSHDTITESAICAEAFEIGRGYSPCGKCAEKIGAAIFTDKPCYQHQQTSGVADLNGRYLLPQELEFGMRIELLTNKIDPSKLRQAQPVSTETKQPKNDPETYGAFGDEEPAVRAADASYKKAPEPVTKTQSEASPNAGLHHSERNNPMQVKGFVIDTKPDKNAMLVLRPNGKVAIVKSAQKHYARALRKLNKGEWICCTGEGETVITTSTFTRISMIPATVFKADQLVIADCTNYCDNYDQSGLCLEVSVQTWNKMLDNLSTAIGRVATEALRR